MVHLGGKLLLSLE
jgi:hypothetical protein